MGSRTQAIGFDDDELTYPDVPALRRAVAGTAEVCRRTTEAGTTSEYRFTAGAERGLVVWTLDRPGADGAILGFAPFYRPEGRVELTVEAVALERGPADVGLAGRVAGVLVCGAISNPIAGSVHELEPGDRVGARISGLATDVVAPDPGAARTLLSGAAAGLPAQEAFASGVLRAPRRVAGCSAGQTVWDARLDCGGLELPISIAPADTRVELADGMSIAARVWLQIAIL